MIVAPITAGKSLGAEAWRALRTRAMFDFFKWDVQSEDHPVLATFPLLLTAECASFLSKTAEALTREALDAEEEMLKRPRLLERLSLPATIRKVMLDAEENVTRCDRLRVMRFDFHYTTEGWRISEVNADVPGGFIEASGWNALFAEQWPDTTLPPNPSEIYAQALHDLAQSNGLVALVHATGYSDDHQVMRHLANRVAARGVRTCLLSPAHLRWREQRAEIHSSFASGRPDAVVRFFPAEWLPNLAREDSWKPYFKAGLTSISNPGSAIVLQTKRFPLVWEELRADLTTWRALLPETCDPRDLKVRRDESWILKPALGRVGEGIGIAGVTSPQDFEDIQRSAHRSPENWVAQRRFSAEAVIAGDRAVYPCIGVFTIGGKAAGFYGRAADRALVDQEAQDVAVLVDANTQECVLQ